MLTILHGKRTQNIAVNISLPTLTPAATGLQQCPKQTLGKATGELAHGAAKFRRLGMKKGGETAVVAGTSCLLYGAQEENEKQTEKTGNNVLCSACAHELHSLRG